MKTQITPASLKKYHAPQLGDTLKGSPVVMVSGIAKDYQLAVPFQQIETQNGKKYLVNTMGLILEFSGIDTTNKKFIFVDPVQAAIVYTHDADIIEAYAKQARVIGINRKAKAEQLAAVGFTVERLNNRNWIIHMETEKNAPLSWDEIGFVSPWEIKEGQSVTVYDNVVNRFDYYSEYTVTVEAVNGEIMVNIYKAGDTGNYNKTVDLFEARQQLSGEIMEKVQAAYIQKTEGDIKATLQNKLEYIRGIDKENPQPAFKSPADFALFRNLSAVEAAKAGFFDIAMEIMKTSGAGFSTTPDKSAQWTNAGPVPKLGQTVNIKVNGIGAAVVIGYYVEGGYQGVVAVPKNPPEWFQKQNGGIIGAVVYGVELSEIKPLEKMAFNITFEIITPESCEAGEADETGFISEGETFTFSEIVKEIKTRINNPQKSESQSNNPRWITGEYKEDYKTGAIENRSYHPANARAQKYWPLILKAAGIN